MKYFSRKKIPMGRGRKPKYEGRPLHNCCGKPIRHRVRLVDGEYREVGIEPHECQDASDVRSVGWEIIQREAVEAQTR